MKNYPEITKVLITEEEIKKKVSQLADEIIKDYINGKPIVALCVLKGAVIFYSNICQKLAEKGADVRFEFVRVRSYENTESKNTIEIRMNKEIDVSGKNVLIIEDITDTGQTSHKLKEFLNTNSNPKNVKICSLLDKPARRVYDCKPDYIGFEIPDKFVVGYGMDCNEKFRALPFIGIYKSSCSRN